MLPRIMESPARQMVRRRSRSRLMTHVERTMSQATVGEQTENTNLQTSATVRNNHQRDQEIEDLMGPTGDVVFISPEEERKVQRILELARKGKINANNAFDLPVRVLDPAHNDPSNTRFWKFASELLGASMNIYDKRVQNVVQSTHRMFQSLNIFNKDFAPSSDDDDANQEPAQRRRKEKVQHFVVDLALFDPKNMDCFQIASQKLQEKEKLTFKNPMNHFSQNPIFNANLKAFDSNCIETLFFNIFYCNPKLEVNLFNYEANSSAPIVQPMYLSPSSSHQFKNQLQKTNILVHSSLIFEEISRFKTTKVPQEIVRTNLINSVKDFNRENKEDSYDQLFDALLNENEQTQFSVEDDIFSNQNIRNDNNQVRSNNCASQFPWPHVRQTIEESYFDIPVDDQTNLFSFQSPWEISIKAGRNGRRNHRKQKEKKRIIDSIIYFDCFVLQSKEIILKKQKIERQKQKQYNVHKHTRAKRIFEIDFYRQNFFSKGLMKGKGKKREKQIQFETGIIQMQGNEMIRKEQYGEQEVYEKQDRNEIKVSSQSNEGADLRSIRQVKQQIINQMKLHGSIKLSQLTIGLSVQSITTFFLHIVSQMGLQIESSCNQTDLILRL